MSNKTAITQRMESLLKAKHHFDIGKFLVFEVQFGFHVHGKDKEYCDAVLYETNGTLTCFELKATVSDFHSKAKKTLYGHKNYYVMPLEVYEKVKDEIPKSIGCMVLCDTCWFFPKDEYSASIRIEPGIRELYCIKKCVRQECAKVTETTILWSLLRSMKNRSNRNVEENTVIVDKAILNHLQIIDLKDSCIPISLRKEKTTECPAIELFVSKDDAPEDYEHLLKIIKGGSSKWQTKKYSNA